MAASRDKSVFVVNDDPVMLRFAEAVLQHDGLRVRAFSGAEPALAALRDGERPDAIVTDLHMPEIDGWRFCRLLRSPEYPALNEVPVLVISATFSGAHAEQLTTELGANGFLAAPFPASLLRNHVRSLLRGESPRHAPCAIIVDGAAAPDLPRAFRAHGYRVLAARTVAEARALFGRHPPDVVALDYPLPDADAEALLAELKAPGSMAVVVMMTADPTPDLATRFLRGGADGYVRKPFDPEYFIGVCESARRRRALLRVEEVLEQRTQELRVSRERMDAILRTVQDAIYLKDRDGRFVFVNPGVEDLAARPAAQLVGKTAAEVFDEATAEALAELDRKALAGEPAQQTLEVAARSGWRTYHVVHRAIEDASGAATGVCGVARDITDLVRAEARRRKLEEQMRHAQKLESLGILAGGVAHDFNNLLVAILGNADLALSDMPARSPAAAYLEEVKRAALRASDLTQQMLAYSGRGHFLVGPADLSALVREVQTLIEAAVGKGVRVIYRLAEGLPTVEADAAQVHQVLMNLVTNASEAIGTALGTVTISTGAVVADRGTLDATYIGSGLPEGEYVVLEVADTGCGMDAATLEKVFDPFFTTKFTGRGLGMAAVLGIVRGHGGTIGIQSAPGKGTVVRVFFPPSARTLRAPEATGENPDAAPASWRAGGRVLVLEREEVVRAVARGMLERAGFTVVEARENAEAFERFRKEGEALALVLFDVGTAGADAADLLRRMRELRRDVPVVAASEYDAADTAALLGDQAPDAVVQKPFDLRTFVGALRKALRRRDA